MKCPRCGKRMKYDFCVHCGYMLNGNIIDTKKKIEASKLEKYMGNDYNISIYNENIKTVFFLGPLYFSYHNHFILGTVLSVIDLFIIMKSKIIATTFLNTFISLGAGSFFLDFTLITRIITFLISRFFYIVIANPLYFKITKKKVDKNKDVVVNLNDRNVSKVIISIGLVLTFYLLLSAIFNWSLF